VHDAGTLRVRLIDVDVLFESDDQPFIDRAERLLGDCRVSAAGPLEVRCRTRLLASGGVSVAFRDPEPLDLASFATALFADRGYRELFVDSARVVVDGEGRVVLIARGHDQAQLPSPVWRSLAANLAINRALRLQPELLFLHAGSVALGGRGIVLSGPKGAGKSTLSLSLAARGHAFLGDEIAAIRNGSWLVEPFRRAASIRQGPRAGLIGSRLERGRFPSETLPDGTIRTQVRVGELLPEGAPAGAVPLSALVLLSGFGSRPRLTPLAADKRLVGRLQALPVNFWDRPPARRVMDFLALVHAVPCFELEAGDPEETAAHLEAALESRCP
jgi:hypothetical protein